MMDADTPTYRESEVVEADDGEPLIRVLSTEETIAKLRDERDRLREALNELRCPGCGYAMRCPSCGAAALSEEEDPDGH
jgi:rubrerythrin